MAEFLYYCLIFLCIISTAIIFCLAIRAPRKLSEILECLTTAGERSCGLLGHSQDMMCCIPWYKWQKLSKRLFLILGCIGAVYFFDGGFQKLLSWMPRDWVNDEGEQAITKISGFLAVLTFFGWLSIIQAFLNQAEELEFYQIRSFASELYCRKAVEYTRSHSDSSYVFLSAFSYFFKFRDYTHYDLDTPTPEIINQIHAAIDILKITRKNLGKRVTNISILTDELSVKRPEFSSQNSSAEYWVQLTEFFLEQVINGHAQSIKDFLWNKAIWSSL